jgi:hypothetical protein
VLFSEETITPVWSSNLHIFSKMANYILSTSPKPLRAKIPVRRSMNELLVVQTQITKVTDSFMRFFQLLPAMDIANACSGSASTSPSYFLGPHKLFDSSSVLQDNVAMFARLSEIRERYKNERLQYLILDDRLNTLRRTMDSKISVLQGFIEMQAERIQSLEDRRDDDDPTSESCGTSSENDLGQVDADLIDLIELYGSDGCEADPECLALLNDFESFKEKFELVKAKSRGKKRKCEVVN